jgi:hypothetical protein
MASNEELLLELRGLKQRVAEIEQQLCSRTSNGRASCSSRRDQSTFTQGIDIKTAVKHRFGELQSPSKNKRLRADAAVNLVAMLLNLIAVASCVTYSVSRFDSCEL